MKSVGIFGGAFDPPTLGHLKLADYLIQNNYVDEVWLMPCYKPAYKKVITDSKIRLKLCKESVEDFGNKNIIVSDFEIINCLKEETYGIINKLLHVYQYNNYKFFFVIGMDNANTINKWKNHKQLLNKLPFIVIPREGYDNNSINTWFHKEPHIFIKQYIPNIISSTKIRDYYKFKGSDKADNYITKSVKEIINELNLYS